MVHVPIFIVDGFEQWPTIACFSSAVQFIRYISRSQSQSVSHYSGLYVYPSHWSVFCTSHPSHSTGHYLPYLDIAEKMGLSVFRNSYCYCFVLVWFWLVLLYVDVVDIPDNRWVYRVFLQSKSCRQLDITLLYLMTLDVDIMA